MVALLRKREDIKSFLSEIDKNQIFMFMSGDFHLAKEIAEALSSAGVRFIGAHFPAIIYMRKIVRYGAVIFPVRGSLLTLRCDGKEQRFIGGNPSKDTISKTKSVLVIVDGFSAYVKDILNYTFSVFGPSVTYVGCGAQAVFSSESHHRDSGALVLMEIDINARAKHGWKRLAGPLIATKTDYNRIIELNWNVPLQVYKTLLGELKGIDISPQNFSQIAPLFPFGMLREGMEDIVRDPIRLLEDGSIECVGNVPENSVLFLMEGSRESLIKASKDVIEGFGPNRLIFDCVSRMDFLGKDFNKELDVLTSNSEIAVGALTEGEIFSKGLYPIFLNKTVVCVEGIL